MKEIKVPNLTPLEDELRDIIGIRPQLTGQIRGCRLEVESEDLSKAAGVMSSCFKSLKLKTFNSEIAGEEFWMTISWQYNLALGGSNGIDVLIAWYSDEKGWTFRRSM